MNEKLQRAVDAWIYTTDTPEYRRDCNSGKCDSVYIVLAAAARGEIPDHILISSDLFNKMRKAIGIYVYAKELDQAHLEHLERACNEGWENDPTGSSWLTESAKRAQDAMNEANQLIQDAYLTASREEQK